MSNNRLCELYRAMGFVSIASKIAAGKTNPPKALVQNLIMLLEATK